MTFTNSKTPGKSVAIPNFTPPNLGPRGRLNLQASTNPSMNRMNSNLSPQMMMNQMNMMNGMMVGNEAGNPSVGQQQPVHFTFNYLFIY